MQQQPQNGDYKGLRALLLLRVSTPEQEEKYGWPSQERSIREKLIEALGLRLDEEKHIIRDTYTGLEFRERPVLNRILKMAERREFDVLCMDVLDRLGRRGLERELYRMQLREQGVRILTTDPDDHSDDDSLIGEMIRYFKGIEAENELKKTRRRTMNGRRERAEEGKLLGASTPLYGYMYPVSNEGILDNTRYVLNEVVIHEDQYGVKWTEVKVVIFLFVEVAAGRTLRNVALELIERGVPTRKNKVWTTSTISHILRNTFYIGKAYVYKERVLPERKKGSKRKKREVRPLSERIWMPDGVVPPIIDCETFEKVQQILQRNKKLAARNNQNPEETLLRGGLAKCGYCKGNLTVHRTKDRPERWQKANTYYYCARVRSRVQKICRHHTILSKTLDDAAWQAALEIIKDPTLVDKKIKARRTKDPTIERRKHIATKLAARRRDQAALRENLADLMKKRKPDSGTIDYLTKQLQDIAKEIEGYETQQEEEEQLHHQWRTVEEELTELHRFCAEMREKMSDPDYIPPFQKKREALEFFGITAILWGTDHKPRYQIEFDPPSVVTPLSRQRSTSTE